MQKVIVGLLIGLPVVLSLYINPIFAQSKLSENTWQLDDSKPASKGRLNQVAWLSGTWVGKGLGGDCEEWWGQERSGQMQGAFRFDLNGKLVFTEHFVLAEQGDSLVLKLKHFGPDLKGWEEKDECVEFKLVELKEREARFEGLTYRLVAPNHLEAYVLIKSDTGETREEKFDFKRR
jgi:hypothetical protein